MAIGRLSVGVGPKGKAGPHAAYIAREGKYAKHNESTEKLEATGSGNMPAWAETDPNFFWKMSDDKERKNGTSYREHVIALPRELTPEQRQDLIKDWIAEEIGDKHAYQYAIHNPLALDGGEQPHAHIMFSERLIDSIERDPDSYFKRYNSKNPERGGAKKANVPKLADERKLELKQQRDRWEKMCNLHLENAGSAARISMKSLADQGIEREPINLSMQQIKRTDIKEIYTDLLTAKSSFKDAKSDSKAINAIDELSAINEKYYEQANTAINAASHAIDKSEQLQTEFNQYRDSGNKRFSDRSADRDRRVSSSQRQVDKIESAIERQQRLSAISNKTINSSKQLEAVTDRAITEADRAIDARLEQQQQQRIAQSEQQQRIESRSALRLLNLQLLVKVVQHDNYSSNRERGTVLKNAITAISVDLFKLVENSEYQSYKVIISNKDDRGTLINPELSKNDTAQAIESFMLRPEVLSNAEIMTDYSGKINIREFTEKYHLKCDFNDLKELDQLNPVRTAEPIKQRIETPKPSQDQQNNIDLNY